MDEKTIALLSVVGGALAYFTGFCYLNFYYGVFGVTPLELDFGIQYVFVHAFPPVWYLLTQFYLPILIVILLLGLAAVILHKVSDCRVPRLPTSRWWGVLALFVIAAVCYNVARFSGQFNAKASLKFLPVLSLTIKQTNHADFSSGKISANLRHLITTETTIFAVASSGDGEGFWTVRIPKDTVAVSTIYRD